MSRLYDERGCAEGKLSIGTSGLAALVIVTEEGLQIAHECSQALVGVSRS
jgi:hypothetical protein